MRRMASSERDGAALHCLVPQLAAIEIEHERGFLRYGEPAADRQFAFRLPPPPTRVTEPDKTLPWTLVVTDVAQHVRIAGHRDAAIDIDGAGAVIVGAVHDEPDLRLHRPAGIQANSAIAALAVEAERGEQLR